MNVELSIEVGVSADEAWRVIVDGFGEIAEWTTTVDGSRLLAERVEVGAARECLISGPGTGDGVTVERVTALDRATGTFAYEAMSGLPGPLRSGRTTYVITPLGDQRCRITAVGEVEPAAWAWPLRPLVGFGLRRAVRRFSADLTRRLEHGAG